MSKWHKGPPPSVGWWPASNSRCNHCYRWWNGSWWSVAAWSDDSFVKAAICAKRKDPAQYIEWKHRPKSWPARSRT